MKSSMSSSRSSAFDFRRGFSTSSLASPPPNSLAKNSLSAALMCLRPSVNRRSMVFSNSAMMSFSDSADFSRSASSRARNSSRSFVCENSFTICSPLPTPASSIFILSRSIARRRFSCSLLFSERAPSGIAPLSQPLSAGPTSATPSRTSSSKRSRKLRSWPRAALAPSSFVRISRIFDSSSTDCRSAAKDASLISPMPARAISRSVANFASSLSTCLSVLESRSTSRRTSSLVSGAVPESPSTNALMRPRMSERVRRTPWISSCLSASESVASISRTN